MWEGNSLIKNVLLHALLWVKVVIPRNRKNYVKMTKYIHYFSWKSNSRILWIYVYKEIMSVHIALWYMFSRKFVQFHVNYSIDWFHEYFSISRNFSKKPDNLHYHFVTHCQEDPLKRGSLYVMYVVVFVKIDFQAFILLYVCIAGC